MHMMLRVLPSLVQPRLRFNKGQETATTASKKKKKSLGQIRCMVRYGDHMASQSTQVVPVLEKMGIQHGVLCRRAKLEFNGCCIEW